jgi:ABC-type molybdate transport system ATPase subunit
MLYVTHSEVEMERLADWVILVEQGALHWQGSLADWQTTQAPMQNESRSYTLLQGHVLERDSTRNQVLIQVQNAQIWVPDKGLQIGETGTWHIHS